MQILLDTIHNRCGPDLGTVLPRWSGVCGVRRELAGEYSTSVEVSYFKFISEKVAVFYGVKMLLENTPTVVQGQSLDY